MINGGFILKKAFKLNRFVFIAIMSALCVALSFIEIPFNGIIPLKLDLSDLIVLFCLLTIGINSSLAIILFRFIFRFLIIALPTHGAIVGLYAESIALISTIILSAIVFIFNKIIKKENIKVNLIIITPICIIGFTFIMVLLNFLFITPTFFSFYLLGEYKIVGFNSFISEPSGLFFHHGNIRLYFLECLGLYGIFNFIKGAICVSLSMLLYSTIKKRIINLISSRWKSLILAGGCFWGVEEYFSRLKGITKTTCVYVDGNTKKPKYEELKSHIATHAEGVLIKYQPDVISLETILDYFFEIIDPFSLNKQGHDEGIQYRSGIYVYSDVDKDIVWDYMENKFSLKLAQVKTYIKLNPVYYKAERYHQRYLKKNPNGYCHVDLNILDNDPNAKKK
jgi:methionine-S-sulfoxide reductase